MNKSVISLYKPPGMTPLEAVEKLRTQRPELINERLGYAGRLDPMAEGVLVILVGDENLKRKTYEKLPKKYEFELLLGIATDTYDGMGMVTNVLPMNASVGNWKLELQELLMKYIGTWNQPYPPYSSARVNGKPLFYWAREGLIETINAPSKRVSIETIDILKMSTRTLQDVLPPLIKRIENVNGEFRQNEIIAQWQKLLQSEPETKVGMISMALTCSSGVYVRGLCDAWGKQLKTGGLAYSIKRTAVGDMTLKDTISL